MDNQKKHHFKTVYWTDDQSTEVHFEPIDALPAQELVSACFVFGIYEGNKVVMTKPKRGWGLPGGHREGDEAAEECVKREAKEEASITLKDLRLIGRWAAKKKFKSPLNDKYPDLAYQLLYVANVDELGQFNPEFETSERSIVLFDDVKHIHHDFANFEAILNYILEILDAKKSIK